jgi:hypothetical protein
VATNNTGNHPNYFRKAGYKYQSNVNKMANDDDDDDYDFGQDWEELCRTQKYDFHIYVTVDCDVATSGVSTVEELCEAMGLQGVWRTRIKKKKMYKIWCKLHRDL